MVCLGALQYGLVFIMPSGKCKYAYCRTSSHIPGIRYRIPFVTTDGQEIFVGKPSGILKSGLTGFLLLLMLYKLVYYRGHMNPTYVHIIDELTCITQE